MRLGIRYIFTLTFFMGLVLIVSDMAFAHGGGLNAEGCHNNRKTGGYHCHRSSYKPPVSKQRSYQKNSITGLTSSRSSTAIYDSQFTKIKTTQTLLSALGYYNGRIDGLTGHETNKAILEFTKNFGTASLTINDDLILKLSTAVNDKPKS